MRADDSAEQAGEQRVGSGRVLPGFGSDLLSDVGITRREVAVLELVAEGRTNEEIGISLGLSRLTIKKHVERMCAKVGASNRAALVAIAWQRSQPSVRSSGRAYRKR